MVKQLHTKEDILNILSVIRDPEIPVVTIEEMGMLRDVFVSDDGIEVIITPTYTGCPAMGIIEHDIKMMLDISGIADAKVTLVYNPAWTTDWMSDAAKDKLMKYGISPPQHSSCVQDKFEQNQIECPLCHSKSTTMISRFGSTACKSLYQCNDCKEPFEYFKCH